MDVNRNKNNDHDLLSQEDYAKLSHQGVPENAYSQLQAKIPVSNPLNNNSVSS